MRNPDEAFVRDHGDVLDAPANPPHDAVTLTPTASERPPLAKTLCRHTRDVLGLPTFKTAERHLAYHDLLFVRWGAKYWAYNTYFVRDNPRAAKKTVQYRTVMKASWESTRQNVEGYLGLSSDAPSSCTRHSVHRPTFRGKAGYKLLSLGYSNHGVGGAGAS